MKGWCAWAHGQRQVLAYRSDRSAQAVQDRPAADRPGAKQREGGADDHQAGGEQKLLLAETGAEPDAGVGESFPIVSRRVVRRSGQ